MILYTADLHFGHANAIKFDNRSFADADEMDKVLMELWNGRVQKDDTVYIVGDLCYRSAYTPDWYLSRLKGHKILVLGNHDTPILNNPEAQKYLEGIEKMMHIKDGENDICLCHFPLAEWNGCYHGTWHIYAHIHSNKNDTYEFMRNRDRALNAGCMINNYMPVSFNELLRNNIEFNKRI